MNKIAFFKTIAFCLLTFTTPELYGRYASIMHIIESLKMNKSILEDSYKALSASHAAGKVSAEKMETTKKELEKKLTLLKKQLNAVVVFKKKLQLMEKYIDYKNINSSHEKASKVASDLKKAEEKVIALLPKNIADQILGIEILEEMVSKEKTTP